MRRTLAVLAMLSPLLRAQNAPVTFSLTPRDPQVVLNNSRSSGPTGSFTTSAGSVTFTIGGASGTLSLKSPAIIAGVDLGSKYQLNSPTAFTLSDTLTGFRFVRAQPFDSDSGGCQVYLGAQGLADKNTDTCNVKAISKVSQIVTSGGTFSEPGVRIEIDIELDVGNSTVLYAVYFQWAVTTGCNLAFDRIEVVQAIHEDQVSGAIPLIANKPTVARVFLKVANPLQPAVTEVTAVLRGTRIPLNAVETPSYNAPITVNADNPGNQENASVNFELPKNWIAEGPLQLEAEATSPACGSSAPKISGSTSASFVPALDGGRTKFRIGWVPYCVALAEPSSTQTEVCPSEDVIPQYDYLLKKLYPIAPGDVVFEKLNVPKQPTRSANFRDHINIIAGVTLGPLLGFWDIDDLLYALDKIMDLSEASPYDQLVGIIPAVGGDVAGASTPYFLDGEGKVLMMKQHGTGVLFDGKKPLEDTNNPIHYDANTLAHELAHNIGRRHTNRSCTDKDPDTDWPYTSSGIQQTGFDPEAVRGKRVKTPPENSDFMSYCINGGILDWTSPFTYSQLAKRHLQSFSAYRRDGPFGFGVVEPVTDSLVLPPVQPSLNYSGRDQPGSTPGKRQAEAATAQAIVSGWASQDGSAAGLDPIYYVVSSDIPPVSLDGGSHCLRFSGSSGPIPDFCFTLSFQDGESDEPFAKRRFSFKLALPSGLKRASLVTGSREIAVLTATSAPPALSIVSPQTGDQWNGGTRTISWSASDPDGMPLVFTVLHSADAGQSWLPLAVDFTDPQFTFDPAAIDGGKNVMFRVMASDGLNSTSVDVGPLEVVQVPAMQLDLKTVDFGNQSVGQTAEKTLTVTNPGSGPLAVTSASIDNTAFRLSLAQPPFTVPAGSSRKLAIQWAVDAVGPQTATLRLSSTDPTQPQLDVRIQGVAVAGPIAGSSPVMSVSTKSLNFGTVTVGQPAGTMKLTISNTGQADLHVNSITKSGDASFSVVPAFAAVTLAAGKSADITVQFAPTVASSVSGSLSIASDDPDPTRNPLIVSLAGTGTTTTGGGACVPPPGNLVSWWTGDGNATDSSGGNNLSVQGGTTFAAGEVGQAFQFDGSTGYVSAGNTASLRLTSAVTVEAWIFPRSAPPTGTMAAILTKWAQIFGDTADSDSYGLWIRQETTGLNLFGAVHQAGGSEPHVQGGTIPLNTWTHVAMTFDSTTGQFTAYVNGVAVSTLTSPGAIFTSSRNVFIGREDSFLPRPFNGLIDEVAVFSRALGASEIQDIYRAGSVGKCKSSGGSCSYTVSPLSVGPVNAGGGSASITVQATPQTCSWTAAVNPANPWITIASSSNTAVGISVQANTITSQRTGTLTVAGQTLTVTQSAASSACLQPPANLVSWWTGDGNATDSSGGNNLSVQGGATFASGEVGQAFQFDGSTGYASAGNAANLRLTSAITVEAWIYPRSAPATGTMAAVLTKWAQIFSDTSDSDSYGLWIRQEATGLNLFGAIHQAGGSEPHVQGGTIPLNAWTHVAMTFDSASGQFTGYVNGVPVSTLTSPGAIFTSSRNVFIGREDSFLPRPFNGLIDEVAVFNRTLSASEIQAIYNAAGAGKCKPTSGGTTRTTLTVDSNTFAISVGIPEGSADSYFLNRLTPPSYPATLRSVHIVFLNQSNSLPAGSPIRVLSGANPSGSSNINGIALTRLAAQVTTPGQPNTYDVTPITITTGDFVVGFDAGYAKGIFPAAVDRTPPSRLRSYFGTDGTTFGIIDTTAGVAGNFGIRAIVDLGSTVP